MPVTTADAEAFVASLNSRTLKKVPAFMAGRFDPVYIFNIYNRTWRRQGCAGGEKTIPACEPGKLYSAPLIVDGFIADYYDEGDGRGNMSWNAEMGAEVAKDLVGIGSYSDGLSTLTTNLTWWGVFIANEEGATPEEKKDVDIFKKRKPTKWELANARSKLEQTQRLWLAEGDRLAAQGKQVEQNHIEAAAWLMQPRNWANPVRAMVECPGCGSPVKPNVAKCAGCGAILDRIKAMELGLIPDTTAPTTATDSTTAAPPFSTTKAAK